MFQYQSAVIADTLLATRVAYYDVLVAEQQIIVNEASVNLLNEELQDQKRRYEAGTVPRFNVLQAEVAVANARPPLINARNAFRIAKNNLSNLLGYNLPKEVWEDIPLNLTDKLEAESLHDRIACGDCAGVGTAHGIEGVGADGGFAARKYHQCARWLQADHPGDGGL